MNFSEVGDKYGSVKCPFPNCNTKIIPYNESLKNSILEVQNSPDMVNVEKSESLQFFRINDMWDFDNIGVSRPLQEFDNFKVDGSRFDIERLLICSECDKGPIGFAGHFEDEEKAPNTLKFYLCCESMKYEI